MSTWFPAYNKNERDFRTQNVCSQITFIFIVCIQMAAHRGIKLLVDQRGIGVHHPSAHHLSA